MPLSNNEKKVQRAIGTGKFLKILTTGVPIKIFFTDLQLYGQTIDELRSILRLDDLNTGIIEFRSCDNKIIELRRVSIIGFEWEK